MDGHCKTAAGLYIHIPFCKSRCVYCDFFSTTAAGRVDDYVSALCREIGERCSGRTVDTVYIGGGTPSWIGAERLGRIFSAIECCSAAREITVECNPDDVTADFTDGLLSLPVNRVSLGVQSLTDERLRMIGRRHSARQAVEAVKRLQAAGYGNISIDFIYGLPGQSMDEWKRDLAEGLSLGVPHLSAYSLMYEEGTALWKMREEHAVAEAHEELSVAMYEHLIDTCAAAGLQQYELSNFARRGCESIHNSSYWEGKAYIGAGAGAHSYDGARTRSMNVGDIDLYIEHWTAEKRSAGQSATIIEHLSETDCFNERVFTALRTKRGLDWGALERDYPTLAAQTRKIADRHVSMGNLVFDSGRLRLTRQALFVSDDIMSDLMAG